MPETAGSSENAAADSGAAVTLNDGHGGAAF